LCYGGLGLILEKHRRLTRQMKRELVKSLRTVALLAIFSPDSNTVGNIQSCLKSMGIMEPDLILLPILERAIPSLEALVEVCGAYNPGS
jgi:proteasome activator subunit 4